MWSRLSCRSRPCCSKKSFCFCHVPICLEKLPNWNFQMHQKSCFRCSCCIFILFSIIIHMIFLNWYTASAHLAKQPQNTFSSSFSPKQWPLCGPCQLQNRSGREWSGGAAVYFSVSARVLLPFSPTIALPFEVTDCCSHAQESCGGDIQSRALLLILRPTDHGTIGRTLVPTTIGHHSPMIQTLPPFLTWVGKGN